MNWFTNFLYRLSMGELKPWCIFFIIVVVTSVSWFIHAMKG